MSSTKLPPATLAKDIVLLLALLFNLTLLACTKTSSQAATATVASEVPNRPKPTFSDVSVALDRDPSAGVAITVTALLADGSPSGTKIVIHDFLAPDPLHATGNVDQVDYIAGGQKLSLLRTNQNYYILSDQGRPAVPNNSANITSLWENCEAVSAAVQRGSSPGHVNPERAAARPLLEIFKANGDNVPSWLMPAQNTQ